MVKLNDKQREEIITSYLLDNSKANIQRICNDYNISKQYIFKLAKTDKRREIEESIKNNKGEFTKKTNEIIIRLLDRIEEEVIKGDKITLSQLSTTLGILYDKSRLESNLSTSNKEVKISIKVE